jgi:hypothetical protein
LRISRRDPERFDIVAHAYISLPNHFSKSSAHSTLVLVQIEPRICSTAV